MENSSTLNNIHQLNRMRFSTMVIIAIVTFLVFMQINLKKNVEKKLNSQTPTEIGQIIRNMTVEKDSLLKEVSDLSLQLYKYRQLEEEKKLGINEAIKNLDAMKVSSGLVAISGPGISVKINDKDRILASYDIVDLFQELRASGAEAISINNVRVIHNTGVSDNNGRLYINDKYVKRPYIVNAIGNSSVLEQALNMPGGYKSTISSLPGVTVDISVKTDISMSAAKVKGSQGSV